MSSSQPSPALHTVPCSGPEAAVPTRIGHRYDVLEQLGRGGMAIVYRVRDTTSGENFALKQLVQDGSARDRDTRIHFEREFYLLAQLSHPGVVEVYDFGVDQAGPYYTMELLDNGDLSSRESWPYEQACQLMIQVCSALSLLHSRRLVHRDVSPRNVRCTRSGSAKLIDFGAVVPMGPCLQVVGTPSFVAPEVVHRSALDARTDVFSVGATLYHALTGCRPFAARTLGELAEGWRHDPTPPGQLVTGIPAALDALILSMLQVDPARRPSSAFEVMQRLAAIAGITLADSAEISSAYLSNPPLVGRATQQLAFLQCLSRVTRGDRVGGGLLFHGASGMGRSRLLDACVLEAKTSGAIVLRFAGRTAGREVLACAYRLAEQLLRSLPDSALTYAAEAGVLSTLFRTQDDSASAETAVSARLRSLESLVVDADAVQTALLAWLQHVASKQPLVIAVDDIERIDEASVGLLVALVHGASTPRLLLVSTLCSPLNTDVSAAVGVLRSVCSALPLAALSALETDSLFDSVFSGVPHAALVSDRIQQLAAGNPRDALALAQYMFDRGLIRYTDGHWVLPSELAVSDLPASTEEALRLQLANLPELSRRLAEAQAVAMDGPWTRADYDLPAGVNDAARVDEALARLLRQGVVIDNAGVFTLSHFGMRSGLLSQLTAAKRIEYELVLAEWCVSTARPVLVEVHHLFQGASIERGLERLAVLLDGTPSATSLREQSGIDFKIIAQIIERAHGLSSAHGGAPRTTHRLARLLLELSIRTDNALYYRHASAWLAQLERDSGLADYRAMDPRVSAAVRLRGAMQTAATRYAATPETERVYGVDEAIQQLAYYAAASMVIGARTFDTELLASLASLLEPFASLSPALNAVWQHALGTDDTTYKGQFERARLQYGELYEHLKQVSAKDLPYVATFLTSVVAQIARLEIALGYRTAEHWISLVAQDTMQRGNAHYLRRLLCIFDGDTQGAERARREAEVVALQSNTRQMNEAPLTLELPLQVLVGDLAAVKRIADRFAQLASEWPGWRAYHQLAQAAFHRMRGDLPAAKDALELLLKLADPDHGHPPPVLRAWAQGAAEYVTVLAELGQLEQAHAFGLRVCQRCNALAITESQAHVRALALVEAQLGQHALAADRLDRLIAQRTHLRPSMVAIDLEARARIAIFAKQAGAAAHFTRLAIGGDAAPASPMLLARRGRLIDEAKRAGLDLEIPLSGFESAVLGSELPEATISPSHVLAGIQQFIEPSARASRVLELLAHAAGASAGHLFYVQQTSLVRVATQVAALDHDLARFASTHLQQWLEHNAMTTIFTEVIESVEPRFATWVNDNRTEYRIALLLTKDARSCIGLVALCGVTGAALNPDYRALSTAISELLLASGDAQSLSAH
jgi:hypothetical protein